MNIFILSCGVFEPELNKILKEIKEEKIFEQDIEVKYLPFGLHTNLNKLKYEILKGYNNIITFKDANCIELIIGDERKKDPETNLYITPGWVLKFDELNKFINAVDIYDIRQQYGRYENVIIGDTKVCEFTDEMIFDLFEKIQVPIEIQDIDINNFKNKIIDAIKKAISS